MGTYLYGSKWTGKYSNNGINYSSTFRPYAYYTVDNTSSDTYAYVTVTSAGIEKNDDKPYDHAVAFTSGSSSYITVTFNGTSKTWSKGDDEYRWATNDHKKNYMSVSSYRFSVKKKTTKQSLTLKIYGCKSPSSSTAAWAGESSGSVSISINAAASVTVTFSTAHGSAPASISGHAGSAITLPSMANARGWKFLYWYNGDYKYYSGDQITYTSGGSKTLYAKWQSTYSPPTLKNIRAFRVSNNSSGSNPSVDQSGTRGFFMCSYTPGKDYDVDLNDSFVIFKQGSTELGRSSVTKITGENTYYAYSTGITLDTLKSYTVTLSVKVIGWDGVTRTITDATTYISAELNSIDVSKVSNAMHTNETYNIAFGGNASDEYGIGGHGLFDCYMDAYFKNGAFVGNMNLRNAIRSTRENVRLFFDSVEIPASAWSTSSSAAGGATMYLQTYNYTFAKPFTSTPVVVLTMAANYYARWCRVYSRTTNGFTIGVTGLSTSKPTTSTFVTIMAIGYDTDI